MHPSERANEQRQADERPAVEPTRQPHGDERTPTHDVAMEDLIQDASTVAQVADYLQNPGRLPGMTPRPPGGL